MLHVIMKYVNEGGEPVGWPTEGVYGINMGRLTPILDNVLGKLWEQLVAEGEAHQVDDDEFKWSISSVDLKRHNEYERLGMQDTIDMTRDVHLILTRKTYVDWLYELIITRGGETHVRPGLPLNTPVRTLVDGVDSFTVPSHAGDPVTIDLNETPDLTLGDFVRVFGSPKSSDEVSIMLQVG